MLKILLDIMTKEYFIGNDALPKMGRVKVRSEFYEIIKNKMNWKYFFYYFAKFWKDWEYSKSVSKTKRSAKIRPQ